MGSVMYLESLRYLVASPNQTQYKQYKTKNTIIKVPLILTLHPSHSLSIPYCLTMDIMHLAGNLSNLLISLWCGTIDCDSTNDIVGWDWAIFWDKERWEQYGKSVESTGIYLPGLLGTHPHNIAEKLMSGYKTWEFQLHTFSLGPILLYGILPNPYFKNYCKLVHGFRTMCQHHISSDSLITAHALLCQWEYDFEEIYHHLQ